MNLNMKFPLFKSCQTTLKLLRHIFYIINHKNYYQAYWKIHFLIFQHTLRHIYINAYLHTPITTTAARLSKQISLSLDTNHVVTSQFHASQVLWCFLQIKEEMIAGRCRQIPRSESLGKYDCHIEWCNLYTDLIHPFTPPMTPLYVMGNNVKLAQGPCCAWVFCPGSRRPLECVQCSAV